MGAIVTRCGYRCDLCLAYKPNVEAHPENRQRLSDGWHKYFGFRIPPEELCCEGCLAESPRLIDPRCPVRPCVMARGLETCAGCESYVCEKLRTRIVLYTELQERLGEEIPEEEYRLFIRPYESRPRLEALRHPAEEQDNE